MRAARERLAGLGEHAQVAAVDLAALAHPGRRGALVGDADLVVGVAEQAADDRRAQDAGAAGHEHALHAGREASGAAPYLHIVKRLDTVLRCTRFWPWRR